MHLLIKVNLEPGEKYFLTIPIKITTMRFSESLYMFYADRLNGHDNPELVLNILYNLILKKLKIFVYLDCIYT